MNKMMQWIAALTVIVMMGCQASAKNPERDQVLTALNECAVYATDVLLDEEGKSRCDYQMIRGEWVPYEEPWHTGQIILGLVEAYRVTGNKKFLDEAERAGRWWIGLEITDNPALAGMIAATHGDTRGNDHIVFSTISDGSHGIFELARETGDPEFLRVALSSVTWMLDHMYAPELGVCYDIVDLKTGEVLKTDRDNLGLDLRPNTEGSPFVDAYRATGEERFRDAHILLSNSLVEKQTPEGAWMDFHPNDKETGMFHPRFNIWYAESLLEAYDLTGDRKYLESAARTARLYARAQRKDGTIYYDNNIDGTFDKGSITGSATAFAGILWMRLAGYGFDEFVPNYELSAQWLLRNRFAQGHPDPNLRGAVIDTRHRSRKGEMLLAQRDVGTSFGMRFLADYYRLKFQ